MTRYALTALIAALAGFLTALGLVRAEEKQNERTGWPPRRSE